MIVSNTMSVATGGTVAGAGQWSLGLKLAIVEEEEEEEEADSNGEERG